MAMLGEHCKESLILQVEQALHNAACYTGPFFRKVSFPWNVFPRRSFPVFNIQRDKLQLIL